ncbi:MAG: hypothetical protein IJE45_05545 [Bacilli bacterium]|nr:hypothetical protein [Bacilli bacterium]
MKQKFKKDFINSFNEKYNYENESLIKEVKPKKTIFNKRLICYLSTILITMILSISITYVVVRNRFIHDNNDPLYKKIVECSSIKADNSIIKQVYKSQTNNKELVYIYTYENGNMVSFLIGISSNMLNEKIILDINGFKEEFKKDKKTQVFEVVLDMSDEYNISLDYYIDNIFKLKIVENYKF